MEHRRNRREFLGSAALGLALSGWARAAVDIGPALCVFSKHLQWLDFDGMAEFAAGVGFDGVDLTVRPGGHVEPAEAPEALPRAVRAVRARGLTVPVIATAVVDPRDPVSVRLLQSAADSGVKYYRTGYFRYSDRETLDQTVERARRAFEGLAELNQRLGLVALYQNHAGEGYLGASIWDLWTVLKDLDPARVGCQFDLRHAVVEGGMAWPVDFRRIAEWSHALVVKDFRWNGSGKSASPVNCPLGEGVTPFPRFFSSVLPSGFAGPVTVHLEYGLGGANDGARTITVEPAVVRHAMERDLQALRGWVRRG